MDALDIFKKLSKGLKFKNRILTNNKSNEINQCHEAKVENDIPDDNDLNNSLQNDSVNINEDCEFSFMSDIKIIGSGNKKIKKSKNKVKKQTVEKKNAVELEQARILRSEHGIKVAGLNPTIPIKEFSSLVNEYDVSEKLIDNIIKCGYLNPTPIQMQAIPSMLENRQILACAPTGSGKTAAFLVPLLHELKSPQRGPRALILCPTRELSKQIYREALRLSADTNLIINFIPKITQDKLENKKKILQKSDLLISTPNRLCFLLDHEESPLNLSRIKWLVIDEADKLFEGSESNEADFRPQLEKILKECFMEASLSLFSATQTPILHEWCKRNMDQLLCITVGQKNAATDLVDQELLYVGNEYGKLVAFRQIVQKGLKPPVLVFVQSKDRAKQLFKELLYDGINVDVIHADRTQLQRDNVVRSFRIGKIWVLICTELMGRGIDFRGVNLVVNYDFPPSAISYVHRIGRAGRAGQKGRAITFFTQEDMANLKSIVTVMRQSGCEVPEYMLTLKQTRKDRKRLLKYAPKRDTISTELPDKETIKRKLKEDNEPGNVKRRKFNNTPSNGKPGTTATNSKRKKLTKGKKSSNKIIPKMPKNK